MQGNPPLPVAAKSVSLSSFVGKVHVEWDSSAAVTPLGQLPFFIEFLKVSGVFDQLVESCPLTYDSPNARDKRDVIGTLLSILSGHHRYAHISSMRMDNVNAVLLGMQHLVSEDSARRALKRMDEVAGVVWLESALKRCYELLLASAWIMDIDTTITPLYGHQEGAPVGYNPHKPGRPSHAYHSYMMSSTRLIMNVEVQPGNRMAAAHGSDVLEIELVRRNIPYVKYGGLKFLEAAHVKDVVGLLRWMDNPRHRIAGFRTLQLLPGVGPGHANRCLNVFEASNYSWETLFDYQMPITPRDDWKASTELMRVLTNASEWKGQLTAVRKWYEPHLARIHDAAAVRLAHIEQLEKLSGQYATREAFLTQLTLDPPQATGDLSGPPLLDEDYLILSTIHSAKGQEWNSVYILNFADGNFPSEFSAGKPELLEEERRLLYVAMTRAKQELHLIAPLKY